jgi:hypothetical protein
VTAKTKDQIKSFFPTGSKPSEAQFIDFIDSYVDKSGPVGAIETAASGMGTGFAAVSGGSGEIWNAAKALGFMGITIYTTALSSAIAVDATRNAFTTTAQAFTAGQQAVVSAYATTAQGNAGTSDSVIMSPVTTKNAIQNIFTGAQVKNSANQALTTGTWTTLSFDQEEFDDANYHDTSTNNSRLTVSVAGRYLVTGVIDFSAIDNDGYGVRIIKNGATTGFIPTVLISTGALISQNLLVSWVFDMAANDYVQLQGFRATSTTNANATETQFSIMRVK